MSIQAVLAPIFVLVALVIGLLFAMGAMRFRAINRNPAVMKPISAGGEPWPSDVQNVSNAFNNQLELPIIFYALVAFALIAHTTDAFFVALEWLFTISRLAHAYIHVTTNYVPHRFLAFIIGVFTLMAMWIIFAIRIFSI